MGISGAQNTCNKLKLPLPGNVAEAIQTGVTQEDIIKKYVLRHEYIEYMEDYPSAEEITAITLYIAILDPKKSVGWFAKLAKPILDNIEKTTIASLALRNKSYFEGTLLGILHFMDYLGSSSAAALLDSDNLESREIHSIMQRCAKTFVDTLYLAPHLVTNDTTDYLHSPSVRCAIRDAFCDKLSSVESAVLPRYFTKVMTEVIKYCIDTLGTNRIPSWIKILKSV